MTNSKLFGIFISHFVQFFLNFLPHSTFLKNAIFQNVMGFSNFYGTVTKYLNEHHDIFKDRNILKYGHKEISH